MSNRWLMICLALLLGACDDSQTPPEGFAGMGSRVEGYTPVTPGRHFAFPADHAPHPGFRIEWWYITANLQDAQGQRFGVQWTLFRNALQPGTEASGWQSSTLWMGHAAVTSANVHHAAQRLARGGVGQAGVQLAPFEAWIDDWSMTSRASEPMRDLHLQAKDQAFAYQLQLRSERPMVLQGDQGYSRKSEAGQASYYYSQPFFTVSGELQIDGQRHTVNGRAWLDREWSSQPLTADQQGWDWFSLHLQDGTRLMLYRIRHRQGPAYLTGTWIDPDGTAQPLGPEALRMQPLEQSEVAGRRLPTRWAIEIPGKGLRVTTTALNAQAWMDLDVPYWEGPVEVSGSQSGEGYLEMTGY